MRVTPLIDASRVELTTPKSSTRTDRSRFKARTLEETASLLLGLVGSEGRNTVSGYARLTGEEPKAVEDAFGYLVQSGYLHKDFKLLDWNYQLHQKTRAKKMKPIQNLLFGDIPRRSRKGRKEGDYAAETTHAEAAPTERWVTRTRQVSVSFPRTVSGEEWIRTRAKNLVEKDDWKIKSWRLIGAKGDSEPHAVITLEREFLVWAAPAEDSGQADEEEAREEGASLPEDGEQGRGDAGDAA